MTRTILAALAVILFSLPASAQERTPLVGLVNWGSEIDPSICWVNRTPAGWEMHPRRVVIENRTRQMLWLEVNGGVIEVVQARYAGGRPLKMKVVAKTGAGVEEFSALKFGERCYGVLPPLSQYAAEQTGWRITAHVLAHTGPSGHFNWVNNTWLYSQGLEETGAQDTDRAFARSSTATYGYTIIFHEREF